MEEIKNLLHRLEFIKPLLDDLLDAGPILIGFQTLEEFRNFSDHRIKNIENLIKPI